MTSRSSGSDTLHGVVIAYTTGDDKYPAVRLSAVDHVREHGCAVILYDADAASAISEPMPNQWGSEGEGRGLGNRLDPDDLEFLGREPLATQVRQARAGGVQAFGWLPKDLDQGALATYAREQRVHLVFVPDELDAIDDLDATGIRIERVRSHAATR